MTSHKSVLRQHLAGATMVLVAVAALAGCGGSEDYKAPPIDTTVPTVPVPPPVTPPPPPVSMIDSFFAYVSNLVGSMLDTDEPASIDAAVITEPENTEPEPVAVAN